MARDEHEEQQAFADAVHYTSALWAATGKILTLPNLTAVQRHAAFALGNAAGAFLLSLRDEVSRQPMIATRAGEFAPQEEEGRGAGREPENPLCIVIRLGCDLWQAMFDLIITPNRLNGDQRDYAYSVLVALDDFRRYIFGEDLMATGQAVTG